MIEPATLSRRAMQRIQRAMAYLVDMAGGPDAFAEAHDINARTVHRMMHDHQLPPGGLARELVDMIDSLPFDMELSHHRRALAVLVDDARAGGRR